MEWYVYYLKRQPNEFEIEYEWQWTTVFLYLYLTVNTYIYLSHLCAVIYLK